MSLIDDTHNQMTQENNNHWIFFLVLITIYCFLFLFESRPSAEYQSESGNCVIHFKYFMTLLFCFYNALAHLKIAAPSFIRKYLNKQVAGPMSLHVSLYYYPSKSDCNKYYIAHLFLVNKFSLFYLLQINFYNL